MCLQVLKLIRVLVKAKLRADMLSFQYAMARVALSDEEASASVNQLEGREN